MEITLLVEFGYWALMAIGLLLGFIYFRDLGDITQGLLTVHRKNMLFAIRHENAIIGTSTLAVGGAVALHYLVGAGSQGATLALVAIDALFIGFPWVWLHIGLRNQQGSATFYSLDEARAYVRPQDSVIVIENNGVARAYPDFHIKRPHLAGSADGLGGDNVIMTYCAMTNLGLGYKPEIDGKPLDLEVLAQHGNNLIMKDMTTGEPIQQMYGTRENSGCKFTGGMQQWPTFRMSFRGFQRAYPQGEVFLNKIVPFRQNPLLNIVDNVVEGVFGWGIHKHQTHEALLFETMDIEDERLMRKDLVWGFNVGEEAVAYTEDFVRDYAREQGGPINATVGGRGIVIAYDGDYDSLGIYYNDTGKPVGRIDFFGDSDQGQLERVDTVKAGSFWCVWVNFFPHTDLNRVGLIEQAQAA